MAIKHSATSFASLRYKSYNFFLGFLISYQPLLLQKNGNTTWKIKLPKYFARDPKWLDKNQRPNSCLVTLFRIDGNHGGETCNINSITCSVSFSAANVLTIVASQWQQWNGVLIVFVYIWPLFSFIFVSQGFWTIKSIMCWISTTTVCFMNIQMQVRSAQRCSCLSRCEGLIGHPLTERKHVLCGNSGNSGNRFKEVMASRWVKEQHLDKLWGQMVPTQYGQLSSKSALENVLLRLCILQASSMRRCSGIVFRQMLGVWNTTCWNSELLGMLHLALGKKTQFSCIVMLLMPLIFIHH